MSFSQLNLLVTLINFGYMYLPESGVTFDSSFPALFGFLPHPPRYVSKFRKFHIFRRHSEVHCLLRLARAVRASPSRSYMYIYRIL